MDGHIDVTIVAFLIVQCITFRMTLPNMIFVVHEYIEGHFWQLWWRSGCILKSYTFRWSDSDMVS